MRVATSPWAPLAAVGGQKQVLLYNTQTLELVGVLPFPEGTPRVLKFSRNGSLLLCGGGIGGASGRVVVWDVRTGGRIIEVGSELDEVLSADISSDQTLIALGGPQRVVRIYSTESGQLMHEIRKHTDWVTSLEFSPDSVLLASGDRNGGLFVWEAWTGREYLTLKGHTGSINDVSWRSDSGILASASEDSTIKLWEMENGGQVKNWGAHGGGASSVEFTRDGRLVSTGRDKTTKLWDQNGGQQRAFEPFADVALNVSYCDETNRTIAGDWTGEIRVWNASDGARAGGLTMNAPTLEERLAAANQTLVVKQHEQQPVAQAYQAAKAAFEQINSDFLAAQKRAGEAKQLADAMAVALVNAKEKVTTTSAERESLSKQLEGINTTLPFLKDAADKALTAATKVADDPDLAAAAQKFKSAADAMTAQQATIAKTAQEQMAALEKAQQEMKSAQDLANQSAAAFVAAQQVEQQLLPQVKPSADKAAAAKQSFDQSTEALTLAEQSVARWTDEIAFTQRLDELHRTLDTASQALMELEDKHAQAEAVAMETAATLAKASADLAAAVAELASNKTEYAMAIAATDAAKRADQTAVEVLAGANAQVTSLGQVVAALTESTAKAEQAAAIAKDDPSVVDAANRLKTLVGEKSKQLQSAMADVTAKAKAQQDAKTNLATNEKQAADTLAAQQTISQRIDERTATATSMQQAANAATQATEAAAKLVVEAQRQVDNASQAIAVAQGLSPAP